MTVTRKELFESLGHKMVNIEAAMHEIHDIERYLTSDKFNTDTTVQVQDVLNRLQNIKVALTAE